MKNQYSLVVHVAQQRELSLFVARLRPHVLRTMAASRDARMLQATGLQLLVIPILGLSLYSSNHCTVYPLSGDEEQNR